MTTEEKSAQDQPLRFAVPPHFIRGLTPDDIADMMYPGGWEEWLKAHHAGADEIRDVLINLRYNLHWSRAVMARFLGVSQNVVKAWETGARQPSSAARRLVMLMDGIVHEAATRLCEENKESKTPSVT
jgi:hypothetical protein